LWRPSDITKIESVATKGGNWILLIKSATNVLKGDNYVFVSPDLLVNKLIFKKGDVITSSIFSENDLNRKSINLKIQSLLRETRNEIKSKGSQANEIKTNGNFVKKIRDFLKENRNVKFKLEVVSLRDSKTAEPIVVEINILKIVVELSKEIYNPEYKFSKAGVLMQDLTNSEYLQQSVINYKSQKVLKKSANLMRTIDLLNKKYNDNAITWAIIKNPQSWKMNNNFLSRSSTTDIKRIPTIVK